MSLYGNAFTCADTRSGDVVPRPLGETVHGTAPNEVVHLTTCMRARVARNFSRFDRGYWFSVHLDYHG